VVSVKALGPNIHYGPGPGMTLGLRCTPTRISGNSQIPALIMEAHSLQPFQLTLPDIPNLGLNVLRSAVTNALRSWARRDA
jgi:hypothetical protein